MADAQRKIENGKTVNTDANAAIKAAIDARNAQLIAAIRRAKVDTSYAYELDALLDLKTKYMADHCASVLDFGKSSRHRFAFFKPGQIETADINQFDGYPDRFIDICDAATFPDQQYDGIICTAILEHVYEPSTAVNNLYKALKPGGILLGYVPFVFRYHSPENLSFQDYYRYTRDGVAYLLRDFNDVTLYTERGRASAAAFFWYSGWKYKLEKRFPAISKWLDKLAGGYRSPVGTTGYIFWAIK